MPSSPQGKHNVFNRSFDTASQNTIDSYETGPSHRSRRTVPYVNERREFDPRYDPRNPETFLLQHQPRRTEFDDEDRTSPDADHPTNTQVSHDVPHRAQYSSTQLQDQQFHDGAAANRRMDPSSRGNTARARVAGHFDQMRQLTAPMSAQNNPSTMMAGGAFFNANDARLDRPFDESSNSFKGSAAEIDSLDEILQQDSFTTATETTGEERFENVLSAIEEHPSLEANSLSYSLTQQLTGSMLPSMKSADSGSDRGPMPYRGPRSHSPLDTSMQSQTDGNMFRNQGGAPRVPVAPNSSRQVPESNRSHHFFPEQAKYTERSARSPLRINTWDTSNQSSYHSGISSRSTVNTTPETPSAASSSLSPSEVARKEAERMLQSFGTSRRKKTQQLAQSANDKSSNNISTTNSASTTEETDTIRSEEQDLTLHDLCGESSSTDDVAWRNALHVLSLQPHLASVLDAAGWTPLHVACLGPQPPPHFMTRSLLYVHRKAARQVDGGGRLPLHLVAASSGDAETMQLLIQEYPQAVYQTDCQGWTPLHLMLKNFSVDVHLRHCRVLLGLIPPEETEVKSPRVLQRRGEHLSLQVEDLERIITQTTPVTRMAQENMHETAFREFPQDVQTSLRRLCQWKRKQRRQNPQNDPGKAVELDMVDAETNPAAHFTPVRRQLPIHIVVRRGLSESKNQRRIYEEDGDSDREEPTLTGLSPRFFELVRLFIAFYPEGLVARDFNGHTPLLAALSMSSAQPSLELVELLLGKRTSGYNSLPSWAHNMPLYNLNGDRYLNPAMIPCKKSHQLPLHVVAEEMANNFSMLSSIQGCYPGAIQCQDSRGRTPLHILMRNYRRSQIDPRTIALLLSDDVAQTLDDEGKLPFDLLVERARCIPLQQPHLNNTTGVSPYDVLIFKKFFQGTIIASSEPNVRNRLESDTFLWRLRSLPPWLRRQACSATFVQELLVDELASPLKCALIMLYAALLCALILAFRAQVQSFIENPGTIIPSWTSLVVYTAVSGLLLFQLIFWSLCMSMSEFLHLCVFNIWRWIDLSALILVGTAAAMLNYPSFSNDVILTTSTAATGMLWFSALGFFASWWYGASLFVASVQKIASLMFWPVVVASILIVGFSQMLYTTAHVDNCTEALGETGLCSLRDSYTLIYLLMIGEPIFDMESDTKVASSIATLAVLFIVAFCLLALSILAIVILAGSKCDFEELALTSFWEPKLTFVIFACGQSPSISTTESKSALETAWVVATDILSGRDGAKGTYWYACFSRKPALMKACYWLIAAIFVPVWLVTGLFTFGLLWPPQVRRFIFRPRLGDSFGPCREKMSPAEFHTSQVSSLRNELAQIRDMSYERSNDVQRDLRQLKEILHFATAE